MVGGSQCPHGHSLCARQQRRSGAGTGEGTDRAATRRDPRTGDAARRRAAAGDPHDSERVRQSRRPDRVRIRRERAAVVVNPKTAPFYNYFLRAAESLSPSLGIKIVPSLVENAADIERTIGAFARTPNGGLLLAPDVSTQVHRDLIIALA